MDEALFIDGLISSGVGELVARVSHIGFRRRSYDTQLGRHGEKLRLPSRTLRAPNVITTLRVMRST